MKRILVICFICFTIVALSLLTSCSRMGNSSIQEPNEDIQELDDNSTNVHSDEYYKMIKRENVFYITVFDKKSLPFDEIGPFPKEPEIEQYNSFLIRISYQTGTGKETEWSVYYDLKNHRQSDFFYGVLADDTKTVVYCGESEIIIQDFFDEDIFYYEFSDFPKELSPTATPFISAMFVDDDKGIEIKYLSGADYQEETITIPYDRAN